MPARLVAEILTIADAASAAESTLRFIRAALAAKADGVSGAALLLNIADGAVDRLADMLLCERSELGAILASLSQGAASRTCIGSAAADELMTAAIPSLRHAADEIPRFLSRSARLGATHCPAPQAMLH